MPASRTRGHDRRDEVECHPEHTSARTAAAVLIGVGVGLITPIGFAYLAAAVAWQQSVKRSQGPVIVVTASSVHEVVAGTSALVRKPYDIAALLEALESFKRA